MKRFVSIGLLGFFNSKDLAFERSGESSFRLDFSKKSIEELDLNDKCSHNLDDNSYGTSSLIILFLLFLFSNFLS